MFKRPRRDVTIVVDDDTKMTDRRISIDNGKNVENHAID